MKVAQIYDIMNTVTTELLGESVIVNEDLSNIVDLGTQFEEKVGYDNYVRSLVDHIGRVVFVDRVYAGRAPSVVRDGWEYGAILEKISTSLPDAQENESWNLQDGQSYDPFVFKKPDAIAKFFSDRITFDVQLSITNEQVKGSFSNVNQLNGFMSMLYTSVENSLTVKLDALIMRTINSMIGETLYAEYNGGAITGVSGIRAVNLLTLYNQTLPSGATALTADDFIHNADALRFASYTMRNYVDRLKVMSTLFNIGGQDRFTPQDRMSIVMLSEFANAAGTYLYDANGQFLTDEIKFPNAETVTYWQGSGIDYDFDSTSAINIKTGGGHTVNATGVLAVMFDRDALGVANVERAVDSIYNGKARFTNNFYHYTAGYWNDLNENFVVFYVA